MVNVELQLLEGLGACLLAVSWHAACHVVHGTGGHGLLPVGGAWVLGDVGGLDWGCGAHAFPW